MVYLGLVRPELLGSKGRRYNQPVSHGMWRAGVYGGPTEATYEQRGVTS